MAGYTKVFAVGTGMTYDGVTGIKCLLLLGESDRQWLEPWYGGAGGNPLGKIKGIIPAFPNDPNALIDACIAFLPDLFRECPSFPSIRTMLESTTQLDFHLGRQKIPADWNSLREEARPIFTQLVLAEADLKAATAP